MKNFMPRADAKEAIRVIDSKYESPERIAARPTRRQEDHGSRSRIVTACRRWTGLRRPGPSNP